MFEKEAENYATRECCTSCNNINHFCKEKCECWTFAKKGVEYGYIKGIKTKVNTTTISDCPIKDEWHRVSDKLPEMDVLVYLWKKGKDFPVVAYRHFPYGRKEWVWNCEWGSGFTISQLKGRDFLWKEIIPPKEIEEND